MAEAVNPGRRYESPRRREQAAATRQAILETARRLFERDGYSATSMPAIAAEARVAVKTVYIAFGTKAALLRTLWDQRLAGGEAATPVLERTWYREVVDDDSPEGKLRLAARQSRTVKTRSGSLLEVIRSAASQDPEIAGLWQDIQTKLHQVARALVAQLHDANALRPDLDPATAADLLWTLNHPAVWQLLVRERRWKPEQYEHWLEGVLRSQLLARTDPRPKPDQRPSSTPPSGPRSPRHDP